MALWTDLRETWYAALESGGQVYGLARQVPSAEGIVSEYLDRTTGKWIPSSKLADVFTGIGGVTDGTPVDAATAAEIERALRAGASG